MPFFGQVWLWSLAGFLVGALLCWALIANPARKRVADLESRLASARRRTPEPVSASQDFGDDRGDFDARDYSGASTALVPGFAPAGQYERDDFDDAQHDRADTAHADFDRADVDRGDADNAEHDLLHRDRYDETEDDAADRGAPLSADQDLHEDYRGGHTALDDERHAGSLDGGLFTHPEVDEPVHSAESTQFIPAARLDTPDDSDEDRRDWFARQHLDVDTPGSDDTAADDRPADEYLVDDLADDERADDNQGTIFTQHTTPIPAELIRKIDAEGKAAAARALADDHALDHSLDHALIDDLGEDHDFDGDLRDAQSDGRHELADNLADHLADHLPDELDDEHSDERRVDAHHVDAHHVDIHHVDIHEAHDHGADDRGEPRSGAIPAIAAVDAATQFVRPVAVDRRNFFDEQREPAAHPEDAAVARVSEQANQSSQTQLVRPVTPEPEPAWAEVGGRFQQPSEEPKERTQSVLPKRIPAKPQNRLPFGVQTSSPTTPQQPAASSFGAPTASDRERSLFEPVRPAEEASDAQPPPPPLPNRQRGARTLKAPPTGVDPFVPPGPFGPGSAMPLPGGRSPSEEYLIKASVTALRYCAPESPKFDRTIAEVWFRSVADAERVGFRPLA